MSLPRPRSTPANSIASPHIVVNSADVAVSKTTLTICRVISPRGLTLVPPERATRSADRSSGPASPCAVVSRPQSRAEKKSWQATGERGDSLSPRRKEARQMAVRSGVAALVNFRLHLQHGDTLGQAPGKIRAIFSTEVVTRSDEPHCADVPRPASTSLSDGTGRLR
jgi:hypothetical protein